MEIIDDILFESDKKLKSVDTSFWYFLNNWKYSWIYTWSSAVVGFLAAFLLNNSLPAMMVIFVIIYLLYIAEYVEWAEDIKREKKHRPIFYKILLNYVKIFKKIISKF